MTDLYNAPDLFSQPDDEPEESGAPTVLTVSELTAGIRGVLELNFETVWLEGELSGYKVAQSKHAYFNLKDDRTQIRGVMFRGARSGMKFEPEDGDQVLVFGRITVYEARGDYQVIVETMEPRGLGALQKAFEQLKQKLDTEGLFDPAHKKPLPEFPWKIGVVTSPTGAVIRDILNVLKRRNPKVSVLLYPVRVQGEGSGEEIARAIHELNNRMDLDLLIVGRGGGSIEDLWAFNEEVVARAIYASRLPIISAVGHEVDVTISDFVADLRAPTPSAAAELAVPVLDETMDELRELASRLIGKMEWDIEDYRQRLRSLIERRFFREPRRILEIPAQRLDDLTGRLWRHLEQGMAVQRERLKSLVRRLTLASPEKQFRQWETQLENRSHLLARSMSGRLQLERQRFKSAQQRLLISSPERRREQLASKLKGLDQLLAHLMLGRLRVEQNHFDSLVKQLEAFSPLKVLGRGYSLTTNQATGKVVTDQEQVKAGDRLRIRLARGQLDATVEDE